MFGRRMLVLLVRLYQIIWHPIYAGAAKRGVVLVRCNLDPSCSDYALYVLRSNVPLNKAIGLIWNRLANCHKSRVV
jgi:putative component of membrane protein insertase Oxa1/YidC/SpoIIIJ protein YidD